MFKYLLGFALFSPLLGIILMEQGGWGFSIGRQGHPNGASWAYVSYLALLLLFAWLTARLKIGFQSREDVLQPPANLLILLLLTLVLNSIFLFAMVFLFGGIQVLSGAVTKETFRTSLGMFGSIAYWITLYLVPAGLAYASFLYLQQPKKGLNRVLLVLNFALAFFIGATWGFKSTAVMLFMPSLIILYWKIGLRQLLIIVVLTMVSLFSFSMFFDQSGGLTETAAILFARATVIQGDVPWAVWDLYKNDEPLPPYAKTLLPVVGDTFFSMISGVNQKHFEDWVSYHYDLLLTHVVGYPYWGIEAGHNVTGTPFAEGIIAFGSPFFLLFSVFAGILVGTNYNLISSSLQNGRPMIAALGTTYFCFKTFAWLNGGAIISLFHISVFIGIAITFVMLKVLTFLCQCIELLLVKAKPKALVLREGT